VEKGEAGFDSATTRGGLNEARDGVSELADVPTPRSMGQLSPTPIESVGEDEACRLLGFDKATRFFGLKPRREAT